MRKVIGLLFALLLLVVPAMAQDSTIAEIVVASTEAEEPEFTTLLTAVTLADEAVLEALSNPEAELTVFAPTDAAFAALAEALGEEAFNGILEDSAALTDILLYHVYGGVVFAEDVAGLLEENMGEFAIEMWNGDEAVVNTDEDGGIFIAGAQIVATDIEASNGVVHVIDAVMVPPADDMEGDDMGDMGMDDEMMSNTIADIVVASTEAEEPEFTTLLTAVTLADEAVLAALSNPEAELTVFAPTDAAFAALAEALGEEAFNGILEDSEALTNILLYHVIGDVVTLNDVIDLLEANDGEFSVEMFNGADATVNLDEDGAAFIAGAQIVTTDIEADNGVIHVIDAVMVPPTE